MPQSNENNANISSVVMIMFILLYLCESQAATGIKIHVPIMYVIIGSDILSGLTPKFFAIGTTHEYKIVVSSNSINKIMDVAQISTFFTQQYALGYNWAATGYQLTSR